MRVAPTSSDAGHPAPTQPAGGETFALHLAVSRSSAVRLAPVAAALAADGLGQALVDLTGHGSRIGTRETPPQTLLYSRLDAATVDAAVELALKRSRPSLAIVAGDGEASVAAALAVIRAGVPLARLGGGLRGDGGTPAEVHRIALDGLADLLLTDGEGASERLRAAGVAPSRIRTVGSTVPDSVLRWRPRAVARDLPGSFGLKAKRYVLATLHSGEDARVAGIVEGLRALSLRIPVVLCLPAGMRATIGDATKLSSEQLTVTHALDYLDFLSLLCGAGAVVTDSAGVQEETTTLGIRCYTLGCATERDLTVTHGTNVLLGDEPEDLAHVALAPHRRANRIPLWDGRAGARVAEALREWVGE